MDLLEQIVNYMKEKGEPVNATDVSKNLNVSKLEIDKAFVELKKSERIYSPVRCKYTNK